MRIFKLFLVFLFCFALSAPAFAARQYGCSGLTGGTAGMLDSLDITGATAPNPNNLANGDTAFVLVLSGTTGNWYRYVFDADATDAEASPNIIRPDDYSTAGVWRLVSIASGMLPAASGSSAGTMSAADYTKLSGIESNATADQTGAEIKAAYEAEADTNAYTDAEKTKLGGVEAGATADQTDAEIETAYNNQVSQVSEAEKTAGTETGVRRMSPDDIKDMIDTHGGGGSGDISGVLDTASGTVNKLVQSWTAFTAADATPDVSTAMHWKTADTTTITDFDGTPADGQQLILYCGHAGTIDLTSSGIVAHNRSTDWTMTVGAVIFFAYQGTQWYALNIPDEVTEITTNGLITKTGDGTAAARTITAGDSITVANGDGVSGNPTISVTLDASSFNGNLAPTDDTVQEVAQKLNDLVLSGAVVEQSAAPVSGDANGFYFDTDDNTLSLKVSCGTMPITTGTFVPFADTTAPTISSASIDGTALTVTFDEVVNQGAAWANSTFDLDMSTTGSDIGVTYSSGNGTNTWSFTAVSEAVNGETVDLDFSGLVNAVEDDAGNDLAAVVSQNVTNNTAPSSDVTDDFNRANGDLGSNWTAASNHAGTLQINSNAVVVDSANTTMSIYSGTTFDDNQFAQIDVSGLDGYHGAGCRGSATGNGYAMLSVGTASVRIYRIDAGARESLATYSGDYSNQTFKLQCSGTTITAYADGVELGSVTDSTYTSGSPFIYSFGTSLSYSLDNFVGGDL